MGIKPKFALCRRACGAPYNLEVIIRDQDGRICRTEKRTVEPESSFEWTASADIPAACGDDELSVGSMEIRRSSARPGVRGTTRPQPEILAPNGACSVHAQAYKTAGRNGSRLIIVRKISVFS